MKRLSLMSVLLLAGVAAGAQAQGTVDPTCAAATQQLQDACQKTVDLFKYMAPELGTSIAGGNTTLGQGGALGGLPHFTVELRATGMLGTVPDINKVSPSTTGAQSTAFTTSHIPVGFPAVDAALGVFGGVPLGLTSVGAIDILANVAYVPTLSRNSVSIDPQSSTQIGFGARVGILQESILVPGVALSYIHRGLPKTTITGTTTSGSSSTDSLQIANLDLSTNSWRLTASKNLIFIGLAAGVGQDMYHASTDVNVMLHRAIIGRVANATPFNVKSDMTRTNAFVDAYMNILLVKLVGEIGVATGGTVNTFNTFDTKPNAMRVYGAAGIRFGL